MNIGFDFSGRKYNSNKDIAYYYFNGANHPFIQLNAGGTADDKGCSCLLDLEKFSDAMEFVGLFGTFHNVESSATKMEKVLMPLMPAYIKKLALETKINREEVKVFVPSKNDLKYNPTAANEIYNQCGKIWTRSKYRDYNVGFVGGNEFSCSLEDSIDYCIPAFNLDLSKILMTRNAHSSASATISQEFEPYEQEIKFRDVKFLAQVDDNILHVKKAPDGILYCETKKDDDMPAYLSAIIVDKDNNIIYYNPFSIFTTWGYKNYCATISGLKLPKNLPDGCKVGLFCETRNYAYYMDTCGEITWMAIEDGKLGNVINDEGSAAKNEVKVQRNTASDIAVSTEDTENAKINEVAVKIKEYDNIYLIADSTIKVCAIEKLELFKHESAYLSIKINELSCRVPISDYKSRFFFTKKEAEAFLKKQGIETLKDSINNLLDTTDVSDEDIITILEGAISRIRK